MPVYEARKTSGGYGFHVGLLLLTKTNAFIPGDTANASTYDYPVVYRTVPGAFNHKTLLLGDPEVDDAVVRTAKELEALGVHGISSDCGFFINYQDRVRKAVKIPVFLSSLLQLPMVSALLGKDKTIGIITANSVSLGNRVLEISGSPAERHVAIKGLQDVPAWQEMSTKQAPIWDSEVVQVEVVKLAKALQAENPKLGAIILECSLLPPYANAVQEATGLPVFDFITCIDFFEKGLFRNSYAGTC